MPQKVCLHHAKDYPCSCGMGNLYRFIEPLILYLLQVKGKSCGYELLSDLEEQSLTDAEIDKAALYRNLRRLEANGNVKSNWEEGQAGPARRVYRLTKSGADHLEEWNLVLENLSKTMSRFVKDSRKALKEAPEKPAPKPRKVSKAKSA